MVAAITGGLVAWIQFMTKQALGSGRRGARETRMILRPIGDRWAPLHEITSNADCEEIGAVGMKSFDGTARILIENDTRCAVMDAADRPPSLCVYQDRIYAFWDVRTGVVCGRGSNKAQPSRPPQSAKP